MAARKNTIGNWAVMTNGFMSDTGPDLSPYESAASVWMPQDVALDMQQTFEYEYGLPARCVLEQFA